MLKVVPPELVTISEAARRAEVARSTVQRWIARGELAKVGDRVNVHAAARLGLRSRYEIRPGRPCGVKQARERDARSQTEALAAPFLTNGVRGLYRLESVLRFVLLSYAESGRADAAAAVVQQAAGFVDAMRERHGPKWAPGKRWREPWNWPVKRQRVVSPAERKERAAKERAGQEWMLRELAAHRARTAAEGEAGAGGAA